MIKSCHCCCFYFYFLDKRGRTSETIGHTTFKKSSQAPYSRESSLKQPQHIFPELSPIRPKVSAVNFEKVVTVTTRIQINSLRILPSKCNHFSCRVGKAFTFTQIWKIKSVSSAEGLYQLYALMNVNQNLTDK